MTLPPDPPRGTFLLTPQTSQVWEIYPRLWVGEAPCRDETIEQDVLVRMASPLAPNVVAKAHLPLLCEDTEEGCPKPNKGHDHVQWGRSAQCVGADLAVFNMTNRSLLLADLWKDGHSIRISCQAGLNRSCLLAGLVLCRLGYSGEWAVERIRWKRGKFALSNRVFLAYLLEEFGPAQEMARIRAASLP